MYYILKLRIGSFDDEDIEFLNIAISKDSSKFDKIQDEWETVKKAIAIDVDDGVKIGDEFFEKYKVVRGFDSVDDVRTNHFVKIRNEWYDVVDDITNSNFIISIVNEV